MAYNYIFIQIHINVLFNSMNRVLEAQFKIMGSIKKINEKIIFLNTCTNYCNKIISLYPSCKTIINFTNTKICLIHYYFNKGKFFS